MINLPNRALPIVNACVSAVTASPGANFSESKSTPTSPSQVKSVSFPSSPLKVATTSPVLTRSKLPFLYPPNVPSPGNFTTVTPPIGSLMTSLFCLACTLAPKRPTEPLKSKTETSSAAPMVTIARPAKRLVRGLKLLAPMPPMVMERVDTDSSVDSRSTLGTSTSVKSSSWASTSLSSPSETRIKGTDSRLGIVDLHFNSGLECK
mmetsp:Transcript_121391/g.210071  ORF Transcript_121391/g.210071 Transcript_121391/m.210071 type:complete len:206 (-) Transcript_121391:53-670(-)